jgi:hypothetical protein
MKPILLILMVLFVYSCGRKNYQNELTEYNQTFQENIQIIDLESNKIYESFEKEMTDVFYGNPIRTKPWYEKTLKVKGFVKICDKAIINLQTKLKKSSDKFIKFEEQEIDNLKLSIDSLKSYLLFLVDNRNEGLINAIKKSLDYRKWPASLFERGAIHEKNIVFEKIRTDVKAAELYILWYLFTKIDVSCFRFHKIEPVIIPKSEIVHLGTPYEADIILGLVDSTVTFDYEIGDKKYIANEYKYSYKEKVTAKEGIVTGPGRFVFPHRYTEDSTIIPFTIQYEVLKKTE